VPSLSYHVVRRMTLRNEKHAYIIPFNRYLTADMFPVCKPPYPALHEPANPLQSSPSVSSGMSFSTPCNS